MLQLTAVICDTNKNKALYDTRFKQIPPKKTFFNATTDWVHDLHLEKGNCLWQRIISNQDTVQTPKTLNEISLYLICAVN